MKKSFNWLQAILFLIVFCFFFLILSTYFLNKGTSTSQPSFQSLNLEMKLEDSMQGIDELQNFMPLMSKISEKGYGLVFINYDGKENLKKTEAFLKTVDPMIAAQNYFDFNGALLGELGISSLPTSLIVDKSGKIQRVISGPLEENLL